MHPIIERAAYAHVAFAAQPLPYGTREPALTCSYMVAEHIAHVAIPSVSLQFVRGSSGSSGLPGAGWLLLALAHYAPFVHKASCGAYGVRWRLNAK
ncbi:hypothetical protein CFE70_005400 [Pyrenophora teres f. teres 0-1]